ncbi:retrotransposon protein, putative, ty1-copia subclass [Tanacetum coccineum]
MVRSMIRQAIPPVSFWGYALETAAHILSLVPTKKFSKTPFKMWKGKRPSLGHIKIWGCEVFLRQEAQDKLKARSEKCLFVSYLEELFRYLFYKPKDNVIISVNEEPIVNNDTQQEVVTPDKISDSTLSELDEPANYKEAMASPKAAKWKEAMKSEIQSMYDNQFGFSRSEYESCIYDKVSGSVVVFLVLYVDDILLIGIDIPTLQSVKEWLGKCFAVKDLGDATYILGIKIYKDRSKHLIGLSQDTCLDKILKRFKIENSKKGNLPLHHGIKISKDLCPKIDEELDRMSRVPYASVNPGEGHWTAVQSILKYLRNTKDRFLVYGGEEELRVTSYCDASWQTDKDDSRSQSGWVFLLNGGAVTWKSSIQDTVADSTCESEYIAACEASKEAIWIKVEEGHVIVKHIRSEDNPADSFTKALAKSRHDDMLGA